MKKILSLITLFVVGACTNETELRKSIFLPDKNLPELPAYSEWGYNTFGAYYDREPFISNSEDVPLKVIHENNKTSFVFTGQKGVGYFVNASNFSITLTLSDFHPATYSDLLSLHNTTFDLTEPAKGVFITEHSTPDSVRILNGKFQFIRAQYLLVDQQPEEVILSGVFGFQALINGVPVTISDGRFDVGVGEYNFFNY
jgi:hypothetical protein